MRDFCYCFTKTAMFHKKCLFYPGEKKRGKKNKVFLKNGFQKSRILCGIFEFLKSVKIEKCLT